MRRTMNRLMFRCPDNNFCHVKMTYTANNRLCYGLGCRAGKHDLLPAGIRQVTHQRARGFNRVAQHPPVGMNRRGVTCNIQNCHHRITRLRQ